MCRLLLIRWPFDKMIMGDFSSTDHLLQLLSLKTIFLKKIFLSLGLELAQGILFEAIVKGVVSLILFCIHLSFVYRRTADCLYFFVCSCFAASAFQQSSLVEF